MENNSKDHQPGDKKNSGLEEHNQTLKDPGAAVADYGSNGGGRGRLQPDDKREGDSPIQLGEEDTIGNP